MLEGIIIQFSLEKRDKFVLVFETYKKWPEIDQYLVETVSDKTNSNNRLPSSCYVVILYKATGYPRVIFHQLINMLAKYSNTCFHCHNRIF